MPEFSLAAKPALGGYSADIAGVTLSEITDFSLATIAIPLGDQVAFRVWREGLALEDPAPGSSTISGGNRLIWAAPDSRTLFSIGLTLPGAGGVYLTDQSDAYAAIQAKGERIFEALERFSMLDLTQESFPINAAARTTMGHVGVFVLRTEEDAFQFLTARTTAGSFVHALEVVLKGL